MGDALELGAALLADADLLAVLDVVADAGVLVDSVVYGKMPAPNIAYGRVTDGSDEWQYELTSTPEASNSSVGSNEVLPEPVCQATPSRLWQQMFP